MSIKALTILAPLLIIGGIAVAHSGAQGIVKERMDGMTALGKSLKSLASMLESGTIYRDDILKSAQTIQAHSGAAMLERFPEGSLQDVSEASPDIWQDWETFSRLAVELQEIGLRMEADTEKNEIALNSYMDALKKNCAACHKSFRIKK